METWFEADGTVVLSADGQELHMTREEAEGLFVVLGHTLQDMDLALNGKFDNYAEDHGEQPDDR